MSGVFVILLQVMVVIGLVGHTQLSTTECWCGKRPCAISVRLRHQKLVGIQQAVDLMKVIAAVLGMPPTVMEGDATATVVKQESEKPLHP